MTTERDGSWAVRLDGGRMPAFAVAALLVAYVGAEFATELFPHPRFGLQPWNLHPALALALMAATGARGAWLLAVAVLAAWAVSPEAKASWIWSLAAAGITGSYWAAAVVLQRRSAWGQRDAASGRPVPVRTRDIHLLIAVASITAAACALIEAVRQIVAAEVDAGAFPLLAWRWFVADLLGLVVWTPLLMFALGGRRPLPLAPRAWRDMALAAGVLALLLWLVFGFRPLDEFRTSYLLFLPIIAIAMRYGAVGAAFAVPGAQLGLLGALAIIGSRPGTAFEYQLLVFTLAVSSLYIGVLTDDQRRSAVKMAEDERALRERTHALDEAQRIAATAELAAALAHDLSQPLSAIGTYARASQLLAQRGAAEHGQLLEALQHISDETARAGQYLRRMREFFRTGAMRIEAVPVQVLVDSAHAHMRDRLRRAGAQWQVVIEPELPPVRVDAVQIGAVLGNLIGNACDAVALSSGTRRVRLLAARAPDRPGEMVRLTIEDSGPGVPEEIRARLFQPLSTSKPHGMGLGLALSRSIVQRQGGRLWHEGLPDATRFCLELPCRA